MVRELNPLKGDRVLDLATGTGDSAKAIVGKGVTVAGVDISFNMLLRAKQNIRSEPARKSSAKLELPKP